MLNPIEAVDAKEELKRWLAKKPAIVQELARLFPYGMHLCYVGAEKQYVIGYTDDGQAIMLSPIVPWRWEDKREAIARSIYVSAEAARLGALKIVERRAA